ncbi:MAG: helix-turn-helix domain-containing protein [Streptosporangiaceae bacterium]
MAEPNELGAFLRARRARGRPGDVGLPSGTGTRRTSGLRREEISALAGLSIDYYIRLEQGKESNPSGPILDGIAHALRLNDEEHAHLYALANHVAGRAAQAVSPVSRVVRPGVRQLLETVRPCPSYVLTRTSDVRQRRGEPKTFRHPRVGDFTLTYEVLYLTDGQRMSVYQAEPGTRGHDALTLLSMIANGDELRTETEQKS